MAAEFILPDHVLGLSGALPGHFGDHLSVLPASAALATAHKQAQGCLLCNESSRWPGRVIRCQ